MNTVKMASNKQALLIQRYMDGQNVKEFGNLPNVLSLRSALAKRCFALINCNRGGKVESVNVKTDKERMAQIHFAINTLLKLGYKRQSVNVAKHEILWRRIKRFNVAPYDIEAIRIERERIIASGENTEYAIMSCSQKMRATCNYRVMYFVAPLESGLTQGFNPVIFVVGNVWHLGITSGSLWVERCPETTKRQAGTFTVWDSPFPTYDRDGILIHKEQNPNH